MQSIRWCNHKLVLLDQTKLPGSVEFIECSDYRRVAEAIKRLEVRGAPAIGTAAAYGMVLGAKEILNDDTKINTTHGLLTIANELKATRPTAVNLFWAIDRMMNVVKACTKTENAHNLLMLMELEAQKIEEEDREVNRQISVYGAQLFIEPTSILTHCNAGALATAGFGTALGVIRKAWQAGKVVRVFADETRPLLQGARLTAWELMQDGIPVTLISDNMAGWVMKNKMVQAVVVGADRITLNGDVANKIGTYSIAILAKHHNIPFYVAAPISTFDFNTETGEDIVIEERHASEITCLGGNMVAPEGVQVFNPAFDVTPNGLVAGIITEKGIIRPPYMEHIGKIKSAIKDKEEI